MIDWEVFYGSFRKPDFIPGYEIQNRLGGGAFGDVYKARKSSIGKTYAVKFLKLDEATQRDVVERELEHVRHFASIDHPHLVTIEDMGVVQEVPYLIMGYAGEDTLSRRMKRGELDRDSALRLFVQSCRGTLALHDRRLAHFDLKPGNIFIKGDVARVGDYGLAKLLAEGRQTLSFGRGTPHYMAPEMLKNRADHRADIYSLGVILFESVAGQLPFPPAGGVGMSIRTEDNPPEYPAGFPLELRGVVERALRIDPDHRYASIHELLEDLGQTSRQGESVLLDFPTSSDGANNDGPGDDDTSELRRVGHELARGAAAVARGVWDGVSLARHAEPEHQASGPVKAAAQDEEQGVVLSMQTLDDPDSIRVAPGSGTGGAASSSGPQALRGELLPDARVGPGGTVPVPPAVQGGPIGTIVQTVVLGVELLVALVGGPLMWLLRGAGRSMDRGVRAAPDFLARTARLGLLMLLLALAGAFSAVIVVALLTRSA